MNEKVEKDQSRKKWAYASPAIEVITLHCESVLLSASGDHEPGTVAPPLGD